MKLYRAALVIAMVLPIGCHSPTAPAPPTPISIVINNNQNQGSHNSGTPDNTGAPTPGGAIVAVSVRVGIFTQTCPDGGPVPDNATNTIRQGCSATLTATPKDAENHDLTGLPESAFQAMAVSWSVSGGSCLDVDAAGGNQGNKFNRVVKGVATGTCSVCATVNGLTGCARQVTGEQLVRVQ